MYYYSFNNIGISDKFRFTKRTCSLRHATLCALTSVSLSA